MKPSKRTFLQLEQLETRATPATLVGNNKVTYQDLDGDNVTVAFSKSFLTAANVNNVFKFAGGNGVDGSNAVKQQLQRIDLTVIGAAALGTNVTTAANASKVTGGDGFANLGHLKADNLGLGNVTIDGDLGRIDCGDQGTLKQAVGALTVQSWGRFGVTTQPTGAGSLQSGIYGNIGAVRVKSDFVGVFLDASGLNNGKIASITIDGSLVGGSTIDSGDIRNFGDIGPVVIKGNIVGGTALRAGFLETGAGGKIASVTVGGSIIGGVGQISGAIFSDGNMGPATVRGNVLGGGGIASGSISTNGKIASLQIGGIVLGGLGNNSGQVNAIGALGNVRINGDLVGGGGVNSGAVVSQSTIAGATIGGSVFGGGGDGSGEIDAVGKLGVVTIRGSVIGGAGVGSGQVIGEAGLAGATVGGSLVGGLGRNSGVVTTFDVPLGQVRIGGDVRGGGGESSGRVSSDGEFAGVTVGGSLIGGDGSFSGTLRSLEGKFGGVKIVGEIRGGAGDHSGFIDADAFLPSVNVGGSIRSGSGVGSGSIEVLGGSIGNITVGGGLTGTLTRPVFIVAQGQVNPVGNVDLAIGRIIVRGSVEFAKILAGFANTTKTINADAQIGSIFVGGDFIGSSISAGVGTTNNFFGDADDVKAAGAGVKDVAGVNSKIGSVTINGQAQGTAVANGDVFGIVAETIGAVKIGGTPLVLSAGLGNDDLFVGVTGDFKVHEI